MGQIKDLQKICHEVAREKGFYSGDLQERNGGEMIALMHSELTEALEAIRGPEEDNNVGEEFADCVIRIMDTCEYWNIDLEFEILKKIEKNKTRKFKHGKKF